MSVTVFTKDVGDVKERFDKSLGYKWQLEDGVEEYIKRDMGVE